VVGEGIPAEGLQDLIAPPGVLSGVRRKDVGNGLTVARMLVRAAAWAWREARRVEAGRAWARRCRRCGERMWGSHPTRPCQRDGGRSRRTGAQWCRQPPAPAQEHGRRPGPAGK
jgi:hypothetical protein